MTKPSPEAPRQGIIRGLRGGVIVSCQAATGSPLDEPSIIAALARSAQLGGAAGLRINGPANVAAVRHATDLAIIGIRKVRQDGGEIVITPTLEDALGVVDAGASIVALDATIRQRTGGPLERIVSALHARGVGVMADISTAEEARAAVDLGADLVATTLAGYTPATRHLDPAEPALDLLRDIRGIGVPVVVEGRIWTTDHLVRCFEGGAFAVVIGSAITAPDLITRRFVAAARRTGVA
jgi:N-acylglucosamine-6-phosphate 2-epimerase